MANKSTQFKKGCTPWNKGLGIFRKCAVCEKDIWVQNCQLKDKRNSGRFCSKTCFYKGRDFKTIFVKGHTHKVPQDKRGHTEETKKKMSISAIGKHCGKLAWNWIEDRTKIIGRHNRNFHDSEYKQWVINVYKRDDYKCKINNNDCSGRIEAHHILGWRSHPELRYQLTNGITLCHAHHPRKRVEEAKLSPFLMELVA